MKDFKKDSKVTAAPHVILTHTVLGTQKRNAIWGNEDNRKKNTPQQPGPKCSNLTSLSKWHFFYQKNKANFNLN